MSQEFKLPGEKIAFLEEYLSGENTFDDGESVRSTVIGQIEFNKEERIDRNSFIMEFLKEIRYRLYSFIILALIFFII